MSISFAVIGERDDDPETYLVRGDDGQLYAYQPKSGTIRPVECVDDGWQVDASAPVDDAGEVEGSVDAL